MNLLFIALTTNVVIFGVVVFFITAGGNRPLVQEGDNTGMYMIYIAPVSGLALAILAQRLFRSRLDIARKSPTVYEKMESYRVALILRWALLDAAAMFNIVAYMMNCNILHLILTAMLLALLVTQKPSLERLIGDLDASSLEAQVLRDHAR